MVADSFAPLATVPEVPRLEKKKSSKTLLRSSSSLGDYKLAKPLGEGSFGKVRLATKVVDGKKVKFALKEVEGSCEELQVACHNHPNIPSCYDFIKTGDKTFAVMEFADCGDLLTALRDHGPLTVSSAVKVMRQIVSAVEHIHAQGIAHCDIKPENIVITDKGSRVLLCDFGLSHRIDKGVILSKPFGTTRCMAPEMLSRNKDTGKVEFDPYKADIFALGNLMFVMLTGAFPFASSSRNETMRNIVEGKFVRKLPKELPADCRHLVYWMLQQDASRRPSVEQIRRHQFFSKNLFSSNRSC